MHVHYLDSLEIEFFEVKDGKYYFTAECWNWCWEVNSEYFEDFLEDLNFLFEYTLNIKRYEGEDQCCDPYVAVDLELISKFSNEEEFLNLIKKNLCKLNDILKINKCDCKFSDCINRGEESFYNPKYNHCFNNPYKFYILKIEKSIKEIFPNFTSFIDMYEIHSKIH